jgi:exoribonuclease-2
MISDITGSRKHFVNGRQHASRGGGRGHHDNGFSGEQYERGSQQPQSPYVGNGIAIAQIKRGPQAPQTDAEQLRTLANAAMKERNLQPEFTLDQLNEVNRVKAAGIQIPKDGSVRDLRHLLWSSIDNDDSKDLDQIEYSERLPNGDIKVLVAIADVDSLVPKGSQVDGHARHNTTTVYTPGRIFSMLPEDYSTNLTSLNQGQDRLAVVTEMVIGPDGEVKSSDMYRAAVNNKCKLAYDSVAKWLGQAGSNPGDADMPPAMKAVDGIADQVRMQDEAAQRLKAARHENGALAFRTIKPEAVVRDGKVVDLKDGQMNRARTIIEDLMVASNGVAARYLEKKGFPTLRRVVKDPERWNKIVGLAAQKGFKLPAESNNQALEQFLEAMQKKDPVTFPDLSLSVVKLMGRGEYVMEKPGAQHIGHFGLAVVDYSHSTAPNRRYPDLITQRLLKAAIAGQPCPYSDDELNKLAEWCTLQEGNATKVERQITKSAAAQFLRDRVGEKFDAIVSGHNDKGGGQTWVRVFDPPVEGSLRGSSGREGERLRVELTGVNVEKGFIDFERAKD